jgi:hypothetical protein
MIRPRGATGSSSRGLDPFERDRALEASGWIRSEQLEAGFVTGQEVLRDLGWSP